MRRPLVIGSVAACLLFAASSAVARPWHGLTPGVSNKNDVIKKFGSPTRELTMTAKYDSGLVYQGKGAQEHGADEAQFFFDAQGKLMEVFVFPKVQLRKDDVIKAYGTSFEERRTDDFRLFYQYKTDGFVVFFDGDNDTVYQLQFTQGAQQAASAATPKPTPPPVAPPSAPAPAPLGAAPAPR